MDSVEFGTAFVATARKYAWARETGPNTDGGGFVDQCLAALGLPPGNSWCAAAVCWWVKETCDRLGVKVEFRRSARALGLLEKNPGLVVANPQPGDLVVWDHGGGLGHVAVLTDIVKVAGALAALAAIAGNTSADGHSRNGDRVAEHGVNYPDAKIKAFLRLTPA